MRTLDRHSIVELMAHMKRMTNSIAHMSLGAHSPAEQEKIRETMTSFRDLKQFEATLLPMLRKGLEAYYEQVDETTHTEHPFEAKVSLMATYSHEKQTPLFAAHFAQLPSIQAHKRVNLEIEKKQRTSPELKDSQWVRDRSELEKNKLQDVNEVILMDDKEQLYEGMASNFFAVKEVNDKPVIMCASLDHILLGTILKVVIAICEKNDIVIEWTFPMLQDAKEGKWIGCFITSTSRLLLPVEKIYVGDERYA